jgi:hypothetical protein
MIKPNHPEIGRALLASDLKPKTVVWVQKEGNNTVASMWVVKVTPDWVKFTSGELRIDLMIRRYGPDHELLTDSSGHPIQTYEYLGEV